MSPRALMSGASIAGLSAVFWMRRVGWDVRVIERAPQFREGGQNVDVRGVAREVVDRMGLTSAVRRSTTTEEGTRFVDADGEALAEFPRTASDGPTAELEILRGDLAAILRDSLAGTRIEVGTTVEDVREVSDGLMIALSTGEHEPFDLLVIAEGVRSVTRDRVFGDAVERRPLGLSMVYGTIPRAGSDDGWWNWYTAPGSRQVTTRPDPVGTTRATLAYLSDEDELSDLDPDARTKLLRERFDDAGWESQRVLGGFAQSDDVYVDHLTQIILPKWSKGRVVAIGDAAWCVTPLGGGGCSLALVGAYVLAASFSRHPHALDEAVSEYEEWMRPLVDKAQKLPPGMPRLAYPESRWGVAVQGALARIAGSGPLRDTVARKMGEVVEDDRPLPELLEQRRTET